MAERKKTTAKKKAAAKKVSSKSGAQKTAVSPLERWRMVAEAAYYRAERHGFMGGNPIQDWLDSEREIDAKYTIDYGKVMTALNPSEMMEQINKAIARYRFPEVDVDAIMESQRRNVEALTAANQRTLEGMRNLMTRQMEVLRETMDETASAIKDLSTVASPKDMTQKQSQLIRQAVERALSHMREMTETISKSNTEAFTAINTRATENLKQLRALTQRLTH